MTITDALLADYEGSMEVCVAGHPAPRGTYLEIDTGRVVDLVDDGILPASLDGRIATYIVAPPIWGEIHSDQALTR